MSDQDNKLAKEYVMSKLPKMIETTLSVIAKEGIISAKARRMNGGGYNNILIQTKENYYIVNPWKTLVVDVKNNNTFVVLSKHDMVMDMDDSRVFNQVESSIHDQEVKHYDLDFVVEKGSAEQMMSLGKRQESNVDRIVNNLNLAVRRRNNVVCKVSSYYTITDNGNKMTIHVDELVKNEVVEYDYIYNLTTRELTKEML